MGEEVDLNFLLCVPEESLELSCKTSIFFSSFVHRGMVDGYGWVSVPSFREEARRQIQFVFPSPASLLNTQGRIQKREMLSGLECRKVGHEGNESVLFFLVSRGKAVKIRLATDNKWYKQLLIF